MFGPSIPSQAASVTIAWNRNTEGDIAGYRIRWSTTSHYYDRTHSVGNHTSGTLSNLDIGRDYYIAVTAYNSSGLESVPSAEIRYRPSATPTPTPTPTPTATPHHTPTPPPVTFVKAININGNAATINGNIWTSYSSALASGFSTSNAIYSTNITFAPAVDSATNGMLNGGIWSPTGDVNFSQTLANGNYVVYLWAVENHLSNYRSYNVKLEGVQVASAIGRLSNNRWARYGPYNVTVDDGTLNVNLQRITGDPLVQGVEIWSAAAPAPPVARQVSLTWLLAPSSKRARMLPLADSSLAGTKAKGCLFAASVPHWPDLA